MSLGSDTRAREAFWQHQPLLADTDLRAWLLDDGSLTARLKTRCRDFNVQVLRQGRTRIRREEAVLLHSSCREHVIGRDVLLLCGTIPVVFAHSVLRRCDVHGPWIAVAGMGSKPLGAALFADPRIERGPLAFRRLDQAHPLYCAATSAVGRALPALWARRSLFLLRGAPLLVTEAFLPEIAGLPRTGTAES